MKLKIIGVTVLVLCAVFMLVVAGFMYSGYYNVAASEPDNAVLRWALTTTRNHSIDRRAAGIQVPPLSNPQLIQEGFEHYHEMCAGCHLAPGMKSSEIREGLNPRPPVLAKLVPHSNPARLFWVIKHGVKMTGMPAWGASHSDGMIWAMVAFLERLPTLTPAEYQAMAAKAEQHAGHEHQ
ncbi:MAG TPA: cytochrome c [Gammaproteobacteria bacterium]|nr:cytochrome c [Gammaproteobacteria bacterium]